QGTALLTLSRPPPRSTLFPYATLFRSLADVLHRWHTHPDFLDPSGAPKTLQFQGENSFSDLVRVAAGDLPSNAVKVELIRCGAVDRKSTRLNSSHVKISYAVFCFKKKK